MSFNKFFQWGYSNLNDNQFGLWEPTLDRFLLILNDVSLVDCIIMVSSSRYNLYLCNLNSAQNYSRNLIDNSCCENWTLSNKSQIKIGKFNQYNTATTVEFLVPSLDNPKWNIKQEKAWLQICWFWLNFIHEIKNHQWHQKIQFIKKIYSSELNYSHDYFDNIDLVETYILKNLYFERDIEIINQNISSFILNTDSVIASRLNEYKLCLEKK